MKSLQEIQKQLEETINTVDKLERQIGCDCFGEEGQKKIKAIGELHRCALFGRTTEDFIENVKEKTEETDEEIAKLMKRFVHANLGIRI
jgi:hypothetical protein